MYLLAAGEHTTMDVKGISTKFLTYADVFCKSWEVNFSAFVCCHVACLQKMALPRVRSSSKGTAP